MFNQVTYSVQKALKRCWHRRVSALLLTVAMGLISHSPAQAAEGLGSPTLSDSVVAVVNGKSIAFEDYRQLVIQTTRDRFYHGKPPESELKAVAHEVLRGLMDRLLFAEEVQRRGIRPDASEVEAEIAGYDRQYGNSPQWQGNREKLLPGLRAELESRNRIAQLRKAVASVPKPTRTEVEDFYRAKSELFTEPERTKVSVILLRVDPSSPQQVWDAALEEGKRIRAEVLGGGKFVELAKKYSTHESASRGGDLGYLHAGMLAPEADAAIKKLAPGELTEALATLDGVVILKLDSRVPAKLRAFAEVRERAEELVLRERKEAAWSGFRDGLYRRASVQVNSAKFTELEGFPLPTGKK